MTRLFLTASLAALLFVPVCAKAQEFTDTQKEQINALIADYIAKNPKELIASLEQHQMTEQEAALKEQEKALGEMLASLKDNKDIPSVGPDDADLHIVEFLDYNCGYCKKAFIEVQAVLEADKKVKIHFVEMPILGPTSLTASKWALAAHRTQPDKYFAFHTALMNYQGEKSDETLAKLAKDAGLDVGKLEAEKESKEVEALISANMQAAEKIGVRGTPGFIIGDEIVRGYITLDQMKEVIAAERKG